MSILIVLELEATKKLISAGLMHSSGRLFHELIYTHSFTLPEPGKFYTSDSHRCTAAKDHIKQITHVFE